MVESRRRKEFKTLSGRVRLLLSREEGFDVEFKESLSGLDNTDIVAFANSESGGAILVGVREVKTRKGRQRAKIIGCRTGDREKQSIISKAESCVPPADIDIYVENSKRTPFYRIEIPSGDKKPYCTSGGRYTTRGDGRTVALLPGRLLAMFVEIESRKFIDRFTEATKALEAGLADTKSKIVEEMDELLDHIRGMELSIERSLEHIFSTAESAAYLSDEAMGFSDETLGTVHELDRKVENVEGLVFRTEPKIDALLKHFDVEDPFITRLRTMVKATIENFLKNGIGVKKGQMLRTLQECFPGATKEQLELWYTEKVEEIEGKEGVP